MRTLTLSLSALPLSPLPLYVSLFLLLSLSPSFPLFSLSGSTGNSRSSTQMNSYSDSGYQDASSYYGGQNQNNLAKTDLRMPHSYPGTGGTSTLLRNARAEGQAQVQVSSRS